MAKLGLMKRTILRGLQWALSEPEQSNTHPINPLVYERGQDGRRMARFSSPQVQVGDHTYGLRRESFFPYHPDDRVVIGKFCSIADGVRFVFGEHRLDGVATFPLKAMCFGGLPHADAISKGNIVVGNDVWIGANALILSGVQIGHGAVIAAGAVVVKDVVPYSVVGGVPARLLKYRLREDQIAALLKIQWWNWPIEKIEQNLEAFYRDADAFIARHMPLAMSPQTK
jgi:acetyltransferase-like isoleucine patch superfamily enzyme